MIKQLFLLLLKANILSTVVSLALSFYYYNSHTGFEERQAYFVLFIMTVVLCLFNFVFSHLALLNYYPNFRNNFVFRNFLFIVVPVVVTIGVSYNFLAVDDADKNTLEYLSLAGPSLFYLLSLLLFRNQITKILGPSRLPEK